MKRGMLLALVVTAAGCAGGNSSDGGVPENTVLGTVSGPGKENATLTLQGAGGALTAKTDATGGYKFQNVAKGDYTLVVTQNGFAYTPPTQVLSTTSAGVQVPEIVSVTATSTFALSGAVSGDVKSGVLMTLTKNGEASGSALTIENGQYRFEGVADGTYTITPSLNGYSFIPASRPVTLAGAAITGQDFGGITPGWKLRASEVNKANWTGIAMSSDGKYIAGVASEGTPYLSSDYGTSWKGINPDSSASATTLRWSGIDMSSDGKYLAAVVSGGYVYTSDDYGVTWKNKSSGPLAAKSSFHATAISNDGKYIVALVSSAGIFVSDDSGASWKDKRSAMFTMETWNSLAMSSDGKNIAAALSNGQVFISTDNGVTWKNKVIPNVTGLNPSTYIGMSGDGKVLAALIEGGHLFISKDNGATWQDKSSGPIAKNLGWHFVSMSHDGKIIAAGVPNGDVYLSTDSGDSWEAKSKGLSTGNINWSSVAITNDGRFISATVAFGPIYTFAAP